MFWGGKLVWWFVWFGDVEIWRWDSGLVGWWGWLELRLWKGVAGGVWVLVLLGMEEKG